MENDIMIEVSLADLKEVWKQEARLEFAMRLMKKLPSYHRDEVLTALFLPDDALAVATEG